jgi:hypothetical protein
MSDKEYPTVNIKKNKVLKEIKDLELVIHKAIEKHCRKIDYNIGYPEIRSAIIKVLTVYNDDELENSWNENDDKEKDN